MLALLVELVRQTKGSLESIKAFVQLSRGKFSDQEFGALFYRAVTEDIEKADWALGHFLDYIAVSSPVLKKNTVHALIEASLNRNRHPLEEKKIEVFKHFEKDLPEVTVPDEHLKYILETLLQYGIVFLSAHGRIEFFTRSLHSKKLTHPGRVLLRQNGTEVEVSIAFAGLKKSGTPIKPSLRGEGIMPDLELRLVEDVVKRNHGTMERMEEAEKARTCILLKFPGERRKRVYYQTVNP